MTVSSSERRAGPFATNGVQTVFPFAFKVFSADDVVATTSVNGADTPLVYGADYTVQLNTEQDTSPGGTVTISPALNGPTVSITSDAAYEQPAVFTNQGGFYPNVLNDSLDRLTIFVQQLAEKMGRAALRTLGLPVAGKYLATDAAGNFIYTDGTGADGSIRADLAATAGAALVGSASGSTVQQVTAVVEGQRWASDARFVGATDTLTLTNWLTPPSANAFKIRLPSRQWTVTGTGARIFSVRDNTSVEGEGVEPSYVRVDPASTALAVFEDGGSAAKLDFGRMTVNAQGNTSLDAIFRFGRRATQWGTYSLLDNLMARGAPNATAYDLNVNISPATYLSSIDTRDGVINSSAGVGLFVLGVYPISFTRYGFKAALGDVCVHLEAEAPGENAISYFQDRGGTLLSGIISIAASANVKTLFAYNPTYTSGVRVGPIALIRKDNGSRYGDFSSDAAASDFGTVTSAGVQTLTDTSKNWKRNQWKGGAVYIPSTGTWAIVASNTSDTLTILFSAWTSNGGTQPVATNGYRLDYACKAGAPDANRDFVRDATRRGHMWNIDGTTMPSAVILSLYTDRLEVEDVLIGRSNDAARVKGLLKKTVTLDFASVAAQSVGAALTTTIAGAVVGDAVSVTPPDAAAEQGVIYDGVVSAANTVKIYPKNITAGAIDPASGLFIIEVRQYS